MIPPAKANAGWPNWASSWVSIHLVERTGPMFGACWHWYIASSRVMSPSIGSSKTMSACPRPLWGLAAGSLPILTAKAGRFGGVPPGALAPVSGHTAVEATVVGGVVVVVAGTVEGVVVVEEGDEAFLAPCAGLKTTNAVTAAAAMTAAPLPPISQPRRLELRRCAWAGRCLGTRCS